MVLTLPYEEGPAGLRPLKRIVAGLVIVYCALRVNDFDLLLNPLGWAMCATPLLLLRRSAGDPFDLARTSVLAMVCLSAVAVFAGWVGPSLGTTPSPVVELIGVAEGVGGLVAVWLITDAVIRRIRSYGIASGVAVLDVLRWVVVGLGALGTLGRSRLHRAGARRGGRLVRVSRRVARDALPVGQASVRGIRTEARRMIRRSHGQYGARMSNLFGRPSW
ncbi:hypothetical protein ACFSTC_60815 [Nonomuraea ferruginea]